MAIRPATSFNLLIAQSEVTAAGHRMARTWSVASDGSAEFTSISEAVAAADAGDTIAIAAGLYLESPQIEKPVHLVGPGDPRFIEADIDADDDDDGAAAVIIGSGSETIRWMAMGGSIRDLVITRATDTSHSLLASALLRVNSAKVDVERCILADGAQCAVASRGGEVTMVRCHIRNVSIGVSIIESTVNLDRTHIEGVDVLALNMGAGSTATLTDNSFEGQTILRGDIRTFQGNDIDTLFVQGTMGTTGNRISTVVHAWDFRTEALSAVNATF